MKNEKKVLIIEPERIIGLELQRQIEKEGFSVQRPISLEDAEAIITKDTPDLIVADTIIKKQSLFEKIKKQLKKFKLPFIWTGTITKEDETKENDGINVIGTFPKPFDSSKIVARIVNYFKKLFSIKQKKM